MWPLLPASWKSPHPARSPPGSRRAPLTQIRAGSLPPAHHRPRRPPPPQRHHRHSRSPPNPAGDPHSQRNEANTPDPEDWACPLCIVVQPPAPRAPPLAAERRPTEPRTGRICGADHRSAALRRHETSETPGHEIGARRSIRAPRPGIASTAPMPRVRAAAQIAKASVKSASAATSN